MAVSFLATGTVVGHYRLGPCIGRGGMGEIYQAEDLVLGRRVALKILSPELFDRAESVRRFVQEARSASALNHPHILTVYEIGQKEIDGLTIHFMATELVEGTTLREEIYLRRTPLRRLIGFLIQTAEALAKARTVAEPESDSVTMTREGNLLGTVGYMSPEQVEQKSVDHRSDIFSFGCIVYEAATRSRAFEGDSNVDILYKILRESPPPIVGSSDDVPFELQQLIERCLEKRPQDRYHSMGDVALDLRSIERRLAGEPAVRSEKTRARRTAIAIGVAVLILAAIVAVAVFSIRQPKTERTATMRALVRWPSNEY